MNKFVWKLIESKPVCLMLTGFAVAMRVPETVAFKRLRCGAEVIGHGKYLHIATINPQKVSINPVTKTKATIKPITSLSFPFIEHATAEINPTTHSTIPIAVMASPSVCLSCSDLRMKLTF